MGIEVVDWPPYLPDLNPIEHIWRKLKEWVTDHYPDLCKETGKSNAIRDRLISALQEGCNALPEESFENLIVSMQRRVKAVKKAHSWYTKVVDCIVDVTVNKEYCTHIKLQEYRKFI